MSRKQKYHLSAEEHLMAIIADIVPTEGWIAHVAGPPLIDVSVYPQFNDVWPVLKDWPACRKPGSSVLDHIKGGYFV